MAVQDPLLSVVMPVHNAEEFLAEAIESILAQTFKDFEFIIINDGSVDNSEKVIKSYKDDRIVYVAQTPNRGIVATLNRGIELAKAPYIARMDGDDISTPGRFTAQMDYLWGHPQTVLVGGWFKGMSEQGQDLYTIPTLISDLDIRRRLFVGNGFGHGTVIFRKDAFKKAGEYQQEYWPCEDYDLWRRLKDQGEIANIPQVVYRHRLNSAGISSVEDVNQMAKERKIAQEIQASDDIPIYTTGQFLRALGHYICLGWPVRKEFVRHNVELLPLLRKVSKRQFAHTSLLLCLAAPVYTSTKLAQMIYRRAANKVSI